MAILAIEVREHLRHQAERRDACGSGDVKSLKAIRAQGTSTSTGTSTGWVQGSGSEPGHSVTLTSRSTAYTSAAYAAAPPSKRYNGIALVVAGIVAVGVACYLTTVVAGSVDVPVWMVVFTVLVGLAGFGAMIAGVVVTPRDLSYNRDEFSSDYRKWDRSWQCQRCGTKYEV